MTSHQRWTQTDISDLRTRVQAGQSAAQIVTATGRPAAAVDLMIGRLRLRSRPAA